MPLHTVAGFTHIAKRRQADRAVPGCGGCDSASQCLGTDSVHDFSLQGLKPIGDLVPFAAPQMGAEDVRNE